MGGAAVPMHSSSGTALSELVGRLIQLLKCHNKLSGCPHSHLPTDQVMIQSWTAAESGLERSWLVPPRL